MPLFLQPATPGSINMVLLRQLRGYSEAHLSHHDCLFVENQNISARTRLDTIDVVGLQVLHLSLT
jgi:hypothetical protein